MSLYPPLIDGYRSPFFEMPDMKSTIDHSTLYMKKKSTFLYLTDFKF